MRGATSSPRHPRLAGLAAAGLALACSFSAATSVAKGGDAPKERARAKGQVGLSTGPTRARLSPSPTVAGESAKPLTEVVRSLGPNRKLYLVVGDLQTDAPPGTLYNLYIDLPDNASEAVSEQHFIGSINFFNATRSKDPAKAPRSTKSISLDLTRVAESLDGLGKLSKETVITIVPADVPAKEAHPRIGALSIQEQ